MSTSGITSNLLSSILGSSSTENKFATDLNKLAKDLKSGDLSAAKQDYVTLSSDMQNGTKATSATTTDSGITTSELGNVAGSSSSESSFLTELNQLGTDLNNGDLTSSLQDMLSLTSTASGAPATSSSSSSSTSSADSAALIRAIVKAMAAGNSSAASYGLTQLASVSSNSSASSYLKTMAASLDSSSSSSSSSISQLLASANGSSSSSTDLLSSLYGSSSSSSSSGLLSLLA